MMLMRLLVRVCIIKPGKLSDAEYMLACKYIVKWILSNESLRSSLALLVWGCCPVALLRVLLRLSCRLCRLCGLPPGCLVLVKLIPKASERLLLGMITHVALELVPRVVAPEFVPPAPYIVQRHAFVLLAKAKRLLSTALCSMFVHIVIRFGSTVDIGHEITGSVAV